MFGVQLYKNNARVLLSRILSILNLDWLQHARNVRGVYELWLTTSPYKAYAFLVVLWIKLLHIYTWSNNPSGIKSLLCICDMIKGRESHVGSICFDFSLYAELLHFDPNPTTIQTYGCRDMSNPRTFPNNAEHKNLSTLLAYNSKSILATSHSHVWPNKMDVINNHFELCKHILCVKVKICEIHYDTLVQILIRFLKTWKGRLHCMVCFMFTPLIC